MGSALAGLALVAAMSILLLRLLLGVLSPAVEFVRVQFLGQPDPDVVTYSVAIATSPAALWGLWRLARWWLGRWKLKGPAHIERGPRPIWTLGTIAAVLLASGLVLGGAPQLPAAVASLVALEMVALALMTATGRLAVAAFAGTRRFCKGSGGRSALSIVASAALGTGAAVSLPADVRLPTAARPQLAAADHPSAGVGCLERFASGGQCSLVFQLELVRLSRRFDRSLLEWLLWQQAEISCRNAVDPCAHFCSSVRKGSFARLVRKEACPVRPPWANPGCPVPGADKDVLRCEIAHILSVTFERLSPADQQIVDLVLFQDLTYPQILQALPGRWKDKSGPQKAFEAARGRWKSEIRLTCPDVAEIFG